MITGPVKNKVDDIWQRMWEGGTSNPLEVITQLTYLMFMKSLDDTELRRERQLSMGVTPREAKVFPDDPEIQRARWHNFKDLDPDMMLTVVRDVAFPFIKTMHTDNAFANSMRDAQFGITNVKTLQQVVTGIEDLLTYVQNQDTLGDLYEYMLSKLNTSGTNGQFRTPQHIRKMMVDLIDPKPGQLIADPACGTAGFLISAAEHIRERYGNDMLTEQWDLFRGPQFTGFDTDQTMVRIAAMNMLLHSVNHPDISNRNSLSRQNDVSGAFDVILANPPFTGSLDINDVNDSLKSVVQTKQTELLFVALFLRMLKLGGHCACIVPNGVLFRSGKAYRQLREELVERQRLHAIIYMPSGVFKPYSGVSTAVLVFTKTDAPNSADDVWMYRMDHDGYTLDDKRDEDLEHSNIPDILTRFADLDAEKARTRKDQSFLVPVEEIRANDYELSFNRYAEVEYERKEYPPTSEILDALEALNGQLTTGLHDLRALLNEDGE
ncbi:type I restriction-modification system subunit M [Bifidobacterium criceti]|uniref:site-specific DNA-methyltransferase (adenine-specific) n=1 Tax=Bifidobacterium criceti TaxID=1960969 RepID=A0A2A2ED73_9BIFI|nr:class I SAM-dependent DNA methyltransferase [Bifidobacterium criceti]PAU66876.1 DNA methyltransferase [Bifidobacterium criceti]